ncbi:MAG TPA: metal ABC transporter substrate-binding protein [Rectinemataceae bacterium]|nr:metal ABC transporter substrate-binding protein [Rectinemataceae bacterium]
MKSYFKRFAIAGLCVAAVLSLGSCGGKTGGAKKTIVVTYSILGAAVKELAGDALEVVVMIPDGLDPHEWEPSAKDIETINKAALVVENGLGLEEGMENALSQARAAGVTFFTASDHIAVRIVGKGEGIPSGDPDQATGAQDPHLWTDPMAMKSVIDALSNYCEANLGVDLSKRRVDLDAGLDALDEEIAAEVGKIPENRRKLVTGHESMGYFAQRYGFKLVGAVVPNLSSQAESSAGELETLKKLIAENDVGVIFTELSENPKVARALADEAKVKAIPLTTHSLPKDGGYAEFIRGLASTIVGALSQ